jgi:hypothetical protein
VNDGGAEVNGLSETPDTRDAAGGPGVAGYRNDSFGYRGSLLVFGSAAVVRRGPALRLSLRDGKTFLVTVDDAATGAALLNDLIAAEQRS